MSSIRPIPWRKPAHSICGTHPQSSWLPAHSFAPTVLEHRFCHWLQGLVWRQRVRLFTPRARSGAAGVHTYAHFKQMWAPGGAVNTLQDLTTSIVSLCSSVQTSVCCLREPCGKVQSHRQWPQCSSNRLTRTFSEDAGQSDCKSPSFLLLISSVRISKHVWLRVGRIELWKAQQLEHSRPLAWNVLWTDRVGIWVWGSQRVREHKERMPFPVPLFCFKWEGNVCPSTWKGHVLSWHRFDELCGHPIRQNSLLFIFLVLSHSVHAQFMTTCMAQDFKVCVVRVKKSSSPCHPCLHLRIPLACTESVPTLSSYSSTSSTPQTTLPIKKHCVDPQNEECGPVAKTTSLLQVMSSTSTTQRLL